MLGFCALVGSVGRNQEATWNITAPSALALRFDPLLKTSRCRVKQRLSRTYHARGFRFQDQETAETSLLSCSQNVRHQSRSRRRKERGHTVGRVIDLELLAGITRRAENYKNVRRVCRHDKRLRTRRHKYPRQSLSSRQFLIRHTFQTVFYTIAPEATTNSRFLRYTDLNTHLTGCTKLRHYINSHWRRKNLLD